MYDKLPTVAHTVDAEGFVLVNGERVLNAKGQHVKSSTSYLAYCQLCTQRNVTVPLRLVKEYRNSLKREMYFHVGERGAFHEYRHCEACKKRLSEVDA